MLSTSACLPVCMLSSTWCTQKRQIQVIQQLLELLCCCCCSGDARILFLQARANLALRQL